uniref:Uncharacterized protein n=1 Tax=Morchella brunnea TaxID=1174671 RepID=A0A8K1MGB7_9PEZI|nr:hypothetical protein LK370_mgp248 [Morchella brunnea]UBU98343.1 hypothetical protein [Morchella brunnea]
MPYFVNANPPDKGRHNFVRACKNWGAEGKHPQPPKIVLQGSSLLYPPPPPPALPPPPSLYIGPPLHPTTTRVVVGLEGRGGARVIWFFYPPPLPRLPHLEPARGGVKGVGWAATPCIPAPGTHSYACRRRDGTSAFRWTLNTPIVIRHSSLNIF